jgi:nucleotide-binding universal stress UspA family protein
LSAARGIIFSSVKVGSIHYQLTNMRKILLIADALKFNDRYLDFAAYIARAGKAKLVGIFINSQEIDEVAAVKPYGGQLYVEEIVQDVAERRANQEIIRKHTEQFNQPCVDTGTCGEAHVVTGSPLENALLECRYADLLIIDPAISFTVDPDIPSKFVLQLLKQAECPVLIAPEEYEEIEEIVLAYDESKSSVFAIKQFYYHMPELTSKKITVLHIEDTRSATENAQAKRAFHEWLDTNFQNVSFEQIQGEAKTALFTYFMERNKSKKQMLVIGSFGRSFLSTLFKHSTVELVLKTADIPVFIAHG